MTKLQTPAEALAGLVKGVTAKWAKQRRAEERNANARWRRLDALTRCQNISIKEAAESVLPAAYLKASGNGTLPANPRQIYYAARPGILELTGKSDLDSQYFCQTILVDYIDENDLDWNIAWDDRGHFVEPHTGRRIGLGTLAVRRYLGLVDELRFVEPSFAEAGLETYGPGGQFGAVLFVEKEGFEPLFAAAKIAQRFDIAIMSSKGMSVTAARMLVDRICAEYAIPLVVLHDFDITGFSIFQTLTADTRRYTFENEIEVHDLGLRLEDVERLGLESEPVAIKQDRAALEARLLLNGATSEEIDFLLSGRRVELNSMASDVFVKFVEDKLRERGIEKVIPDEGTLDKAFCLFKRSEHMKRVVEKAMAAEKPADIMPPDDLSERLHSYLDEHPTITWDEAIAAIVKGEARHG